MDWNKAVGKSHKFEDGKIIKLVQIKEREGGPWAIFEVTDPPGNPRRFYNPLVEFAQKFQHLFESK
jgi:hypothetical protein